MVGPARVRVTVPHTHKVTADNRPTRRFLYFKLKQTLLKVYFELFAPQCLSLLRYR
jgi:hypothetical protein